MVTNRFKYDLAISFAGEQRGLAEISARRLDAAGYAVFYDEYQRADLWGRDLAVALKHPYAYEARYCLILLSSEYLAKPWTEFERKNAISRFIAQRGEYVLCLKVDEVDLPGFPDTIAYVSLQQLGEDEIYKLLLQKLGPPDHDEAASGLNESDRILAKEIIEACFRRAIYTRMDSEIDLRTMYDSIGMAIGRMQQLIPRIMDQALQFTCNQILAELGSVERTRTSVGGGISNVHPLKRQIDRHKQRVVGLLLEVRRMSGIPMQLPTGLGNDHFYGLDEASEPPRK